MGKKSFREIARVPDVGRPTLSRINICLRSNEEASLKKDAETRDAKKTCIDRSYMESKKRAKKAAQKENTKKGGKSGYEIQVMHPVKKISTSGSAGSFSRLRITLSFRNWHFTKLSFSPLFQLVLCYTK